MFNRYPLFRLSLLLGLTIFSLTPALVVSAQEKSIGPLEMIDPNVGSAGSAPKKFVDLLESKDLSNFRGYQTEEIGSGWEIDGKQLVFDGSGDGDIITKETYDNFELQVEWSISEGGNSGILFRVALGDEQPYLSGPEFQILDDSKHEDGKSELTSAGALYGLYPANGKVLRPVGSWNKSRIKVEGNRVQHFLNGVKVVDVQFDSDDWNAQLGKSKFKEWEKFNKTINGHIAFQNHGNEVKFRNIRIKRIQSGDDSDDEGGKKSDQKAAEPPADGPLGLPSRGGVRPGQPIK